MTSPDKIVAEFKRELSLFYGYDQDFKFVRTAKPAPSPIKIKQALEPRDFLDLAIQDSASLDQERNRINCLGNCKRAIDAQVDRLVRRLGFLPLAKRQGWNIPKKLEFISEIGVVAPRILNRLNQLRNPFEHEFAPPAKEQVEDALDVTTLFVSYAELVSLPTLNWGLSDKSNVRYDYEEMIFHFFDRDPDLAEEDIPPLFSLAYGQDGFQDFYDFLTRVVPAMLRKTDFGEDI